MLVEIVNVDFVVLLVVVNDQKIDRRKVVALCCRDFEFHRESKVLRLFKQTKKRKKTKNPI